MKFVKSGFGQKLIIILIALMIFNIAVPKEVKAWDVGGILLKPISSLILAWLVSIDVQLGVFLAGVDIAVDAVGDIIDRINESTDSNYVIKEEDGKKTTILDIFIGPDTIFCGKISMLDANIFQANSSNGVLSGANMAGTIKKAIAQTYVILRNICALLMLAGLIYIGIRILVDSNLPNKQAQWKQYLTDWLIGLILLIFSHVLMYGVFYISDTITIVLSKSMIEGGMGGLNFQLIKDCFLSLEAAKQIVCIVMLGYLIYLTVIFAISYLKRLMWICILIVIAPIVSVMYAFGPSTKQIYTKWFKEYVTTVFVQPFHMIIYTVLVSLPLNLTNSGGGFQLSVNSTFTLIYALVAVSFIRPAEKYIRDLFGMGQGIAGMASYDSGKQTIDVVVDKAKEVAAVAATVATAGAAAPLAGATMGGAEAGAMAEMGTVTEMDPDILASGVDREDIYVGSRDPFHDDYFAGDPNFDNDLQNPPLHGMDTMSEAELQEELDNMGLEEGSEERALMESSLRESGHGNKANISDQITDSINDNIDKAILEANNSDKESSDLSNIKADNVTITTDNINIQGEKKDSTEKEKENLEKEKDNVKNAAETQNNNDEKVGVKSEGESNNENVRKGTLFNNFMGVATGKKGVFEALSEQPKNKLGRKIYSKARTLTNDLANSEGDSVISKTKRFIGKTPGFLKKFEELGGMQKLHDAFNSTRDTFFVGGAPGDWKSTNARMAQNVKEDQEQQKYEFINKRENREWLIVKYENDLKEQYKGNKNYTDKRLHDMAVDKANAKLKSLADTYVPLGIIDPKLAYECEEDRKEYGYTAQEAVRERVNYENFNIDSKNIKYLNDVHNTNVSSVKESIGENTRDYYNSGYKTVADMDLVRNLTAALNVSVEKGMQLDQVLRRKGGQIDYSKANLSKEQKDVLKPIMDQYRDIQKGKK